MDHLNNDICEEDWVMTMKKELLECMKEKESLYNFNFENEIAKEGRYSWVKVETHSKTQEFSKA